MTTFRPLSNQLLVQRVSLGESATDGGIVLPDRSSAKTGYARVIAVGPGQFGKRGIRRAMACRVGDLIPFNVRDGNGIQIKLDGVEHFVIRESDIAYTYEEPNQA